jgi:uncharacterized damage-inducible protein DinB
MFQELIEQFEKGGEKLRLAIRGLTAEDMKKPCEPGTWSIHQIVIHMCDSDLVGTERIKRVIAMDNPTLLAYDETAFNNALYPHEQSVEDALTIFELNRRQTARILRKLPDGVFDRKGQHNEDGEKTLRGLVQTYVDHLEHHLKFIHGKRKTMGKEMW